MDLLNEYKVIYVAEREGDEGRQLYASKILQGIEEEKLTAYDNGETEIPDLHIFKLIYANGEWYEYLMGSETVLPTENDVNIVFKDSQGNIVYGKVKENPEPTDKYEVTVNSIANVTIEGAGQYAEGETVTITVKADSGYVFTAAPTCSACELVENEGVYSGTFAMPAEAVSVTVTGSVEPDTPAVEMMFFTTANAAPTGIDDNWGGEEVPVGGQYIEHGFTYEGNVYLAAAFPSEMTISSITQNMGGETWEDVTTSFTSSQVTYDSNTYTMYVTEKTSSGGTEVTDTFRFNF